MGMLTLAQLKAEILSFHANRTDQDHRLTTAINFAQLRIAREWRFTELDKLQETTAGWSNALQDRFITLPSTLRTIRSILILDGLQTSKLIKVDPVRLSRLFPNYTQAARKKPVHYVRRGNSIELVQIPDKAYTYRMDYSNWPTPFLDTEGSTVSDLENKDEGIILLAAAWLHKSLGRRDRASALLRDFDTFIAQAITTDLDNPDKEGAYTKVGSSTEYWLDPFVMEVPYVGSVV